jgi:hypothetical protein
VGAPDWTEITTTDELDAYYGLSYAEGIHR